MKNKPEKRRILVAGDIVTTTKKPKWIFGKFDKKKEVWHYVFKNDICSCYVGISNRVIVSRYTKKEIEDILSTQRQFAVSGSLYSDLGPVLFKKFKKSVKPSVKTFETIDSVDDWLLYLRQKLISDEYKKTKLRQLLTSC